MTATSSAVPDGVPAPVRLRPGDLARLAVTGLRARKLRVSLSALGIAIGVAAITAVLGLSASSSAGLLAEIAHLGTNLLTVSDGQTITGTVAELPPVAQGIISRLPGVTATAEIGSIAAANAYRSPLVPAADTNALTVYAASMGLPAVIGTAPAKGTWLNAATARQPATVLGAGRHRGLRDHPRLGRHHPPSGLGRRPRRGHAHRRRGRSVARRTRSAPITHPGPLVTLTADTGKPSRGVSELALQRA
jgi:hypothetical protein